MIAPLSSFPSPTSSQSPPSSPSPLATAIRLACVVGAAALFLLVVETQVAGDRIAHDLSSYLAPAIALLEGRGAPYVDYFDIKPPGLIFSLIPWIYAFGHSLMSVVVLDTCLVSAFLALFYWSLSSVCQPVVRDIAFLSALAVAFATRQFSMLVLSETLGNLLIFLSFILLTRSSSRAAWFVAGVALALAGQVKETYALAVFMLPVHAFWHRNDDKLALVATAGGALLGLSVLGALLWWANALGAYLDVLSFKAEIFRPNGIGDVLGRIWQLTRNLTFKFYPLAIVLLLTPLVWRLRCVQQRIAVDLPAPKRPPRSLDVHLMIAMVVGVALAFVAQGKRLDGHYLLTMWFPYVLVFAWLVDGVLPSVALALTNRFMRNVSARQTSLLLSVAVAICFAPNPAILSKAWQRGKQQVTSGKWWPTLFELPAAIALYRSVGAAVSPGDCVQQAFGWDAGALNIYTKTTPCSRFFLANLVVRPWQAEELRESLMHTPPKVVVYTTSGADLDTGAFERDIFPWSTVLSRCYDVAAAPSLYVANKSNAEMVACVSGVLAPSR